MGHGKQGNGVGRIARGVRLAVAGLLLTGGAAAQAAVITVEAHETAVIASHANLAETAAPPGGTYLGPAAGSGGSRWAFGSADPNSAVIAAASELEDRDSNSGVLEATGFYNVRAQSQAGPQVLGHSASSTIGTNLTGQVGSTAPAPQVSVSTDVTSDFTVSQHTSARLEATLTGNTGNVGASNFVGLDLTGTGVPQEEIDFDAGEPITLVLGTNLLTGPLAYARTNATETHVVDRDLQLDSRRTYTVRSRTSGVDQATATIPFPDPSSIDWTLLLSQDLTGNSETNSLKPNETTEAGHRFLLDGAQLDGLAGSTVWIDPEVAIGFDYLIDGAGVLGITLPSLSIFPEFDYQLFDLGGALLAELTSGQSFSFDSAVSGFSLRGISEALAIDPNAPGFTLGLNFDVADRSTVLITQTPITATTGAVGVPTPGIGSLLLAGLGALFMVRRRQQR